MFACMYSSFHLRVRRLFPRQGALQFKYRSMVNILNSKKNKTSTVTIVAYTTSPNLAQKRVESTQLFAVNMLKKTKQHSEQKNLVEILFISCKILKVIIRGIRQNALQVPLVKY